MKKEFKTIALAGAVLASTATTSIASNTVNKEVSCKGVATKWVNDCQANGHDCAVQAKKNFDKKEWLTMKQADCEVVKAALKSKAMRAYIEKIQKGTVVATKRGKKF